MCLNFVCLGIHHRNAAAVGRALLAQTRRLIPASGSEAQVPNPVSLYPGLTCHFLEHLARVVASAVAQGLAGAARQGGPTPRGSAGGEKERPGQGVGRGGGSSSKMIGPRHRSGLEELEVGVRDVSGDNALCDVPTDAPGCVTARRHPWRCGRCRRLASDQPTTSCWIR